MVLELPQGCRDRYRAIRELGSGAFGVVVLAEQVNLKREVALKILRIDFSEADDLRERFETEARVTASLSHENIVKVLDFGMDEAVPWICYEYVPGRSLAGVMRGAGWSWGRAVTAMTQVADAVEEAHSRGILHRDLKPANVLEAHRDRYKLADFGLARWTRAQCARTRAGVILGTPSYLAPEYFSGGEPTPQTDIYALGITLYELLTRKRPFDDEDPRRVIERHLKEDPPSPGSVEPGLPRWLDPIVARALAKKPADRYGRAGQLAADLRAGEAASRKIQLPTRAVVRSPAPVSVQPPGRAMTGRRRTVRFLGAGLTLAAAIGLGLAAVAWFAGPRSFDIAGPRPSTGSAAGTTGGVDPASRLRVHREAVADLEARTTAIDESLRKRADNIVTGEPELDRRTRQALALDATRASVTLADLVQRDLGWLEGTGWLEILDPALTLMSRIDTLQIDRKSDKALLAALERIRTLFERDSPDRCYRCVRTVLVRYARLHLLLDSDATPRLSRGILLGSAASTLTDYMESRPRPPELPELLAAIRLLGEAARELGAFGENDVFYHGDPRVAKAERTKAIRTIARLARQHRGLLETGKSPARSRCLALRNVPAFCEWMLAGPATDRAERAELREVGRWACGLLSSAACAAHITDKRRTALDEVCVRILR